jgi:hypothetical protein
MDLACGYGGFPLYLATQASKRVLEGNRSDVRAAHMKQARERVRQSRPNLSFRVLEALTMEAVEPGRHDVFSIVQVIHDFRPGQIARMMQGARRVGASAFVAIDGARSPWLPPALVPAAILVTRDSCVVHDAFVSLLKLYDRSELARIARAAAPDARVRWYSRWRGFNLLQFSQESILMKMLRWAAALRAKDRTFRGLIDSTSTALQT